MKSRLPLPVLVLAGVLGLLLMATVSGARHAEAIANCDVPSGSEALDVEESAFLSLINNYRAQAGLPALAASPTLNRAAAWLANDLGQERYFSHYDSLGRSPSARALDCGYSSGAAENIAAGTYADAAGDAFTMWRNSSGHNANMLGQGHRVIGIARAYVSGSPYGWYWVTNFGAADDSGSSGTSSGGTGSGNTGSGTATPTPTPAPAEARATMTSPTAGSTLPGSTVTFDWTAGSSASEYFLYVGTRAGSNDVYGGSMGLARSGWVSGIPTDGRSIYVRLWTRLSQGWQYHDYQYRAASSQTDDAGRALSLVTPVPESRLPGATATFSWSAIGADEYFLYVGSRFAGNDIYGRSTATATSRIVSGLPTDGRQLYVRLWYRTGERWAFEDFTVRAAG